MQSIQDIAGMCRQEERTRSVAAKRAWSTVNRGIPVRPLECDKRVTAATDQWDPGGTEEGEAAQSGPFRRGEEVEGSLREREKREESWADVASNDDGKPSTNTEFVGRLNLPQLSRLARLQTIRLFADYVPSPIYFPLPPPDFLVGRRGGVAACGVDGGHPTIRLSAHNLGRGS
jgi:hypothetical protein